MDTGPVLGTMTERVRPRDTAGDLLDRLAGAGAELLVHVLDAMEDGTAHAVPQPEDGVSLAPKLLPADARVDFSRPAVAVDRLVRGCTPAPGAWTTLDGRRLKLGPVEPVTGLVEALAPGRAPGVRGPRSSSAPAPSPSGSAPSSPRARARCPPPTGPAAPAPRRARCSAASPPPPRRPTRTPVPDSRAPRRDPGHGPRRDAGGPRRDAGGAPRRAPRRASVSARPTRPAPPPTRCCARSTATTPTPTSSCPGCCRATACPAATPASPPS